MHGARGWTTGALAVGGLLLGGACGDGLGTEEPSARQREGRSELLRDMMAAREQLPAPEALDAQRERLRGGGQTELDREPVPMVRVEGTVEGASDGALRVRDARGVAREVRVDGTTRFVAERELVARDTIREGTRVRAYYDADRDDGVARVVEVLPSTPESGGPPGSRK